MKKNAIAHAGFSQIGAHLPRNLSREELLKWAVDQALVATDGAVVRMPAFNYDFTETGVFDTVRSPSQVGPISEYFRLHESTFRTPTPVFSYSVRGPATQEPAGYQISAFGRNSEISKFADDNSRVLFIGAPFSSFTEIHHIEEVAGIPYRSIKRYSGIVIEGSVERPVELSLFVKPTNFKIEYDWVRLEEELRNAGLLKSLGPFIHTLDFRDVRDFWLPRLDRDPLHFLKKSCRLLLERDVTRDGRVGPQDVLNNKMIGALKF